MQHPCSLIAVDYNCKQNTYIIDKLCPFARSLILIFFLFYQSELVLASSTVILDIVAGIAHK